METSIHDLSNLSRRLRHSGEPHDIAAFVATHRLKTSMASTDTPFWDPVQAKYARRKSRSIPGYGTASDAGAQS
ncbi:DUF2789 family protein [Polaromonas sp. P1-6]|nr:DUF2789 family protein [Polaromonas sp. P1-6]